MSAPKRILVGLLSVLAGVVYVWFAAVRAAPGVRRRKEAARQARVGSPANHDPR